MLTLEKVNARYGKIRVLWDVFLRVDEREIVALVGNNGAGKTTLLHTITGLLCPSTGTIEFMGRRMEGRPPHQIARWGISCVPEGGKPFPEMTVRENLDMGAYVLTDSRLEEEARAQVYEIFPLLRTRAGQLARTLSGGERQMLAMGRSLMARPRLLMFDEPSYGLSPLIVKQLFEIIGKLHGQGITILIVEQNIRHALEIAHRGYVLENGRVVMEGPSKDLLSSDLIQKAYLGI